MFSTLQKERELSSVIKQRSDLLFLSSIFFSLSLYIAYWHCMQQQMQLFVMTKMEQTKVYKSSVSRQRKTAKSNALLRGHRPADLKILKKDLPHILHGSIYTSQMHKQHTFLFSYHGGNLPLTSIIFIMSWWYFTSPNPHRNISTFLHCQ